MTPGFDVPLEQVVRRVCAEMEWLVPSDQAAVELAIMYAKWLDRRWADDALPAGTAIRDIGGRLEKVLIELGGTPTARIGLFGGKAVTSGKLADLRAKRTAAAS